MRLSPAEDTFPVTAPLADNVPTVHNLHIQSIRLIAALGDSITAGYGARDDPFIENRGVSFAMGNDPGAITLPNIMSKYQPFLIGPSQGNHLVQVCYGLLCPGNYFSNDGLNAAQSGSMVSNLENQVHHLVRRMKSIRTLDYKGDFKLMTLFIGNNDLCASCSNFNTPFLSPDSFERYVTNALESIKKRIPRTIVNIVMLFNISQLYDLTKKSTYCITKRRMGTIFECGCAWLGEESRKEMDEMGVKYNKKLEKIYEMYQLNKTSEFAVVLDPSMRRVALSTWSLDVISKADCFHPSAKAHGIFARYIWNNLFRKFKDKMYVDQDTIPELFLPNKNSLISTT